MRSVLLAGLFALAASPSSAVDLDGKTLHFSAHSYLVLSDGQEFDSDWPGTAYFSSEGRIFFYFDNTNATGVVIEPGRSSGRLRAGGSVNTVDYSESGNGVAFNVTTSTGDGVAMGLRFTISVKGSKCSVRGFRMNIEDGGAGTVEHLETSPGSCRIADGPP